MQFMFEHFLRKYKYEIYAGKISNLKRLPWYELLILLGLFSLLIASGVFILLGNSKMAFILDIILFLLIVLFFILDNHRIKISRNELYSRYKENKLAPLITLLKSEDFNFFSPLQIEWLILCCDEQLKSSEKTFSGLSDYFFKYIFPFITMFFGFAIKLTSLEDGMVVVAIICLILLFVYCMQRMIAPIVDDFMNPDKDVLHFLKSELKYIKTTL